MIGNQITTKWVSIPNLLSGFRIIAAPLLLYLAWLGHSNQFLALFVVLLLSDSIDGFLARRLNEVSELGAKLDSWGDLMTIISFPLCAWWLWPEILKREAFFVLVALVAYILPLLVGFVKFHRLPSYHTWSSKTSAVLMGSAVIILFIIDIAWPFRCTTIIESFVACESIFITLRLQKLQNNVRSYWHLTMQTKEILKDTTEQLNL